MLGKWCFHLSISLRYAFCFKKILHRNIDFASNLIFWVGIGWGIGHAIWLGRPKISQKLTNNSKCLSYYWFPKCSVYSCEGFQTLHYGLSPIEKGKLRILQNEYLDPHFQLSILKYLGETVWSVSLSFIYLVRDEWRFDNFILKAAFEFN